MNLGPPLRRGAAHAVSHRLSSRSINQLSQVLRPASRFKPAAQHIQSIHQSNRSILIDTCQCNRSVSPIKLSRSISPINQSSASLSLTQSIHPLQPARHLARDESINRSINQSIDQCYAELLLEDSHRAVAWCSPPPLSHHESSCLQATRSCLLLSTTPPPPPPPLLTDSPSCRCHHCRRHHRHHCCRLGLLLRCNAGCMENCKAVSSNEKGWVAFTRS